MNLTTQDIITPKSNNTFYMSGDMKETTANDYNKYFSAD